MLLQITDSLNKSESIGWNEITNICKLNLSKFQDLNGKNLKQQIKTDDGKNYLNALTSYKIWWVEEKFRSAKLTISGSVYEPINK